MVRLLAAILLAPSMGATQSAAAIEPSVPIVQAAYEREAARDDPRHDKNLEVVAVECGSAKIPGQYLCWVTFTSKVDPARSLRSACAGPGRAGRDHHYVRIWGRG